MADKHSLTKIAYLSMEIAVSEDIFNYAGGLGVLAGDFLRSAADFDLPLVAVSLLNRQGYFKQTIDADGRQVLSPETNNLKKLEKLPLTIEVAIASRPVFVTAWKYLINNKLPVYFLDTDLPENSPADRRLTDKLYGGDYLYRLQQEIILGRGAAKILEALGYKIKKYHVNEGHGILVALEQLQKLAGQSPAGQRRMLRQQLIFTNHTPVKAGQDVYPLNTLLEYQPDFPVNFPDLIVNQQVDFTRLGVKLAGKVNAVSKKHQATLKQEFPQDKIGCVTNGVQAAFWLTPEFKVLYDKYLPGWPLDNRLFKKAGRIPLTDINQAHQAAKQRLIDYVLEQTGVALSSQVFTLVFARRFTPYKQPLFLLSDLERLLKINERQPLQIIYAGKAHPLDEAGQKLIRRIYELKAKYQARLKIVFLENYRIALARLLCAGADLWLNTPFAPNEACGTSGMKAALNAVPQISTPDGWWPEAYKKDKNGWLIANSQPADLYQLLETEILPLYYQAPEKWQNRMRQAIIYNAPIFNSERMLKEYWRKCYLCGR